ncbi:MAG: PAS domain S-box protein, partial [Deltaproteobacteria bacterium]|nr:PAS domain S-box protein [Deltaproteobacteria bacterium]
YLPEDGILTLVNNTYCECFGKSRDELIGHSFLNLVPSEEHELIRKQYRSLNKNNPEKTHELTVLTPMGRRWQRWTEQAIFDDNGDVVEIQAVGEDITDRRWAENELRQSEERYRAIFENTGTATIITEEDTTISLANTHFEALSGYYREEIEWKKSWTEFIVKQDLELMKKYHAQRRVDPASVPREYEFRFINRQGEIRDIVLNVRMIPGTRQSVASCLDITERKQAEVALRQSEETYRSILEDMEDSYYEVDLAGNLTFFNPAGIKTIGYDYEELLGKNFKNIMDKSNSDKVFEVFHRVFLTGEPAKECDWVLVRKNGEKIIVETSVSLRRDSAGNIIGFRGIVRDVTERKHGEDALRESERRYRMLAENVREVIWTMDYDLNITYISPSVESLLGYTYQEARSLLLKNLLAPESFRLALSTFKKDFGYKDTRENDDPFQYITLELQHIRKDGSKVWTEVTMNHLLSEEGVPVGLMAVTRDISDRKIAEEEKRKLEGQLLQAERMKAVGTLAGGIAHDFNNLLMGIQGNASLMLMDIDSNHPHFERIKNVEQYVRRGSELTRQLLGFARGGKYEVKPTDLGDLIQKSSVMFERTRKEIRFRIEIQPELWSVEVDQGQIEQVLLNLYVNAWQAMPGGGELVVVLSNEVLDKVFVESRQIKAGRYVCISITDNGVGMDETTKQRIFEPFFTTKKMGRGTGLGLASVYGIVRNHGGVIEVESAKGKGSTFIIHIPASEKAVAEEKKPVENIFFGNETILLVDDEEMIIEVGSQMLERLGYTVMIARNGHEAVKIFRENHASIDMVIMDMIMPEMGGGQTYQMLKEIVPDVCVVLSSGYSIDGQAKDIIDQGCRGFIQKPFDLKDLSGKIRKVLEDKGSVHIQSVS